MVAAKRVDDNVFQAVYRSPGQTVALTAGERGGSIELLFWQGRTAPMIIRCEFLIQPADELGLALGPPVRLGKALLTLHLGLPGDPLQAYATLPPGINAASARACYLRLSPVV